MDHDFRHAAMHRLADWPILARIAARHTTAKHLDSRAVSHLYTLATDDDWAQMDDAENNFGRSALATAGYATGS